LPVKATPVLTAGSAAGFDPDHPLIEDLKWKDYFAIAMFDEQTATRGDLVPLFARTCSAGTPFMRFLCQGAGPAVLSGDLAQAGQVLAAPATRSTFLGTRLQERRRQVSLARSPRSIQCGMFAEYSAFESRLGDLEPVCRTIARLLRRGEDQHVIEDLPPHASDQALDVIVGLWSPVGGEHDSGAVGGEDRVELCQYLASRSRSGKRMPNVGSSSRSIIRVARLLLTQVPVN
jgi:hypothetical protein